MGDDGVFFRAMNDNTPVGDEVGDALEQERPVIARLRELGIAWERFAHPAIATADAAGEHWQAIDAVHCKNLFLRNQKGTRHYLVILEHTKRADLRSVADQIGDGKLSFASPERLMAHLGVTPGSVSPFGLIHDQAHQVRVFLDHTLAGAERISFHPNINTLTYVLAMADFRRFLAAAGNPVAEIHVGS
jgi:Ala-tRNA(Pro) deacylase